MHAPGVLRTNGQPTDRPRTTCQPRCPICSGPFIEMRGLRRCAQCSFTICEGCEGGPDEPMEAEEF